MNYWYLDTSITVLVMFRLNTNEFEAIMWGI